MAPREVLTGNGECVTGKFMSPFCPWARKIELVSPYHKVVPVSQSG
jgi:hypothetical protein